jgi:hypothetical protein
MVKSPQDVLKKVKAPAADGRMEHGSGLFPMVFPRSLQYMQKGYDYALF